MPVLQSPRPYREAGDTVSDTLLSLSDLFAPTILGRAESALVTVGAEPVQYTFATDIDPADPSHRIPAGQQITLYNRSMIAAFRFVAEDSDSTVFVTLFT